MGQYRFGLSGLVRRLVGPIQNWAWWASTELGLLGQYEIGLGGQAKLGLGGQYGTRLGGQAKLGLGQIKLGLEDI